MENFWVANLSDERDEGRTMKKQKMVLVLVGVVAVLAMTVVAEAKKTYYCKYCGMGYQTVNALTAAVCHRHPEDGRHKHELYQGTEKSTYFCQYCGAKAASISTLTGAKCPRHPKGAFKGRHSPAL